MSPFDRTKSLQQLESKDWGEPPYDSHLVTECHRLRRVPLCELTPENLRIMIGQQMSLPYLLPLALELLHVDPFTAGDFYEGDLLENVLRIEAPFWREHQELYRVATEIAERAFSLFSTLDVIEHQTRQESFTKVYGIFQQAQPTVP